jgi:hypothetical protein
MRRPWAIAIAAAGIVLAAGSSAPAAVDTSHTEAEFQLKAGAFVLEFGNHGDAVSLLVRGHREAVIYRVIGDVSEQGFEARFGKLGEVSLQFHPTKTLYTSKPPPECKGDPWKDWEGVYSGTIRFRGERGYVEAEATGVRGEMRTRPDWKCSRRSGPIRLRPDRRRAAEDREDVATLSVGRLDGSRGFAAFASRDPKRGDYTGFFAATRGEREGMLIKRAAFAAARSSAFSFDLEKGSAVVEPPWPFQGSARFRRGSHGHNHWAGSLRVPLLGADPIDLTGPAFHATLVRDFPGD